LDLVRAAVLSAALFLLGGVVPVLGAAAMLCTPAPMLIYALGRPRPFARLAAVLAAVLTLLVAVAGQIQSVGFVLSLGLATVLMLVMIRRQWSFESIVFFCTLAMLAAETSALLIWAGSPAALARQIHTSIAAAMSHSTGVYEKLGVGHAESRQIMDGVLEITAKLAPAMAATLAAVAVLLNLGLVWRWLGKDKVGYQLFGGLVTWRTPEWLIWLLLATGFSLFIPLEPARIAALNGFVLVASIYFCQGLAIMAYYLQMLAMPRIVRVAIYVIALLQPILAGLVCLTGVFDMWIDFRRLKPPSREAGSIDDFF
jgi:uncharacterized protein YybS (DUF2232 family)